MTMWEISPRVAFVVSSADRVLALHLDRPAERPSALLGSAAAIWLQLTNFDCERAVGGVTEDSVTSALAEVFGSPTDVIAPDVRGFLQTMEARGFVVRV